SPISMGKNKAEGNPPLRNLAASLPSSVSPIASKSPISTPTSPSNIIPTVFIRPHHIPLYNHIGILSAWCTTSGWPVLVMCALKAYAAQSVHPADSV
ncbi:hypothetical protein H0H81_003424, partial [Sphagnurus paluster]